MQYDYAINVILQNVAKMKMIKDALLDACENFIV